MKSLLQTTIGETFLWIVANVVCVIVPTASVYVAGDLLFDWGPAAMSFYVSAAAIASCSSPVSSEIFANAPVTSGQSKPTFEALRPIFCA